MQTNIRAFNGIRTNNLSVRAGEDSSCRRPRGQCDRFSKLLQNKIQQEQIHQRMKTNFKNKETCVQYICVRQIAVRK
jgi:hypothetical protein